MNLITKTKALSGTLGGAMVIADGHKYVSKRRFRRRHLRCRIGIFLPEDFFFAEAVQISEGGVLVKSDHLLEDGCAVELHFMLPGRISFLALKGHVIYQIGNDELPGCNKIGIAFSDLPEEVGKLINDFVAHGE